MKLCVPLLAALLYKADETETTYRIVGKDEIEPNKGYISWVSPLAKAMLGKALGDVVKVFTPKNEAQFEVVDIRYCEAN